MNELKIAVLGSEGTGKSALTVRFLTKRFIGEYSSDSERIYILNILKRALLMGSNDTFENISTLCSLSPRQGKLSLTDELHWADGFVLVYDISDRTSFAFAKALLYRIRECHAMSSKRTSESTVVLVGNKQDLCHIREVSWDEGQKLALDCKCQFCELSAAEHSQEVVATFTKLLKNIISNSKGKERRRPSGSKSMAKLINTMFGKRRKSV
ncbi:ras-related and estrogen-regulated growth inhibitor-like protein [Sphaerodactylus townsendi]|uniref:ras-related and estrogen-regulated growth inhibitor-like protein n=1 Tax=Sphaerodactylus townsendi TaxID=933632 RepID=UPI00202743D1|nr:ras-related and estrogen-regulated growth inhibitor-like protein [Sphaerodactylus townsendi]